MISYPYTSQVTGYREDGSPILDRATNSAQQRALNLKIYSPGVDVRDATAFQVVAGEGMSVVVSPGMGMSCAGAMYFEDQARTLALEAADSQDRIDLVVVRDDQATQARATDLYIVKGVPGGNPVAPALTRNSTVTEQCLAQVFVAKNATGVTNQRITDTRLDTEVCGVFATAWPEVDTRPYFAQLQAIAQEESAAWQQGFSAWFDGVKGQLGQDAAGNLQLQLNEQAERVQIFTCTFLQSGWAANAEGTQWIQTAPCAGMKAAYNTGSPWVMKTGAPEPDALLQDALNQLNEGFLETLDGQVKSTLYSAPPACDVQIYLRRAVL